MKLSKSSFVVISVIGQELLAASHCLPAVAVLESALKIGTANLKLKGSVYSALSSAYWALNSLEKVRKISIYLELNLNALTRKNIKNERFALSLWLLFKFTKKTLNFFSFV